MMGPPPMEESAGSNPTTRPGWRNEAQRLLRASPPFLPIFEEPPRASFAPAAVSTPFSPWERWPGNEHAPAPPLEEASRAFMAPLSRLMHPISAALRTPSWSEAPVSFSASYPIIQPAVTTPAFVHSPNPRPITGVHPNTSTVDDLTRREEEYFHRFSHTPRPTQPPFIPPWPPSGPAPPRSISPRFPTPTVPSESSVSSSRTPPVGLPPFPHPMPVGAPPSVGQAYPPVRPPLSQYPMSYPLQPTPATYVPAQWPSYQQAPWAPYPPYYPYQQNGNDEDSETARPDKFTGRDPSKLRPFIICCVMAFDSRRRKFATDRQRVSYAASHLSEIAVLWWRPNLILDPEPSIRSDWSEFVEQLNVFFGQPDLAQASECALRALKMQDYQHVNKYMIEFYEHATHTGWNDAALYGEFYRGLAERIKDQLVSLERPATFQQLKTDALRCDSHYWERQGEKGTPTGWNRQSAFATTPSKTPGTTRATTDTSKPAKGNTGSQFGTDGKLTEVERERRRVKGLCYYCALSIDVAAPDCRNPRHPKPPAAGRATFAITGEPDATIEEVFEEPQMNSGN